MKNIVLTMGFSALALAAAGETAEGLVFKQLSEVRAARAKGDRAEWTIPVVGRQELAETLVLKPGDGPLRFVGRDGATLSGLKPVTGWTESNGVWVAALPRDAAGKPIWFDSLYVNGRRAQRARFPKTGYIIGYTTLNRSEKPAADGEGFEDETYVQFGNGALNRLLAACSFDELRRVQMCAAFKWKYDSRQCNWFDAGSGSLKLWAKVPSKRGTWAKWPTSAAAARKDNAELPRVWFENARGAFTDPGEWFWDVADATLKYRPLPGETIASATVLAPVAQLVNLVRFAGEVEQGESVTDIVFENIAFEGSVTDGGSRSFEGIVQLTGTQAAMGVGGAIGGEGVWNCRFDGCSFRHTENYGVFLSRSVVSNVFTRCRFEDLGAGGIWLGEPRSGILLTPKDDRSWRGKLSATGAKEIRWGDAETVRHHTGAFNEISDCVIRGGGRFNPEGTGVVLTHVSDSKVTRCDIGDLFYTGVSVGWTWGYYGSVAQRNEISFNTIHDLGQHLMADMGGVYTLGTSFGTVVSNNTVSAVDSYSYGGWGLYNDEGSEGVVWENNTVSDTSDSSYHQHFGRNNVVRNNVFSRAKGAMVKISRTEPHLSVSFVSNTIHRTSGVPLFWAREPDNPPSIVWTGNRVIGAEDNGAGLAHVVPVPNKLTWTGGFYEVAAEAEPAIEFTVDKSRPKEGYRLEVMTNGVKIAYADESGRFYALQTLAQLAEIPDDTWHSHFAKLSRMYEGKPIETQFRRVWRTVIIEDAPKYPWRGLHVDECRHFFGEDTIKHVIDTMAQFKLNWLHWHLTDDQGWRIEIKSHPELVRWGAVRPRSPIYDTHGGWEGTTYDNVTYGPFFYTQAQITNVIAYAKAHGITVVPEIEVPGHSRAILAAHPELICEGFQLDERAPWCRWGICEDVVCLGNDATIRLYEDVLDEVCALFDSEVVHIGGDEAPTKHWESCPKCAARVKAEGLANAKEELQAWCSRHFVDYLAKKGRRTVGWDEYLLGSMPPSAIGMSWRAGHFQNGQRFMTPLECVEKGHDLVMTPKSHCYLDYQQGISRDPYQTAGGLITLEQAYSFDPVEDLPAKYHHKVLGGQGNNWTEATWTRFDLDWKICPRAAALAEKLWSESANCRYDDFLLRLAPLRDRLISQGVNCAPLY